MNVGELETYRNTNMHFEKHTLNEKIVETNGMLFLKENTKAYRAQQYIQGYVGLMCPHCYNYIIRRVNYISSILIENENSTSIEDPDLQMVNKIHYLKRTCDFCNAEDVDLIQVDVNIIESISILNKKGFKTRFCCEGHGDTSTNGYILFDNNNIDKFLDTLPITWYLDLDDMKRYDKFHCIRADACNYEEALLDLKEWVDSLPNLVYFTKVLSRGNKNYRMYPMNNIFDQLLAYASLYDNSKNHPLKDLIKEYEIKPINLKDMEGFKVGESQMLSRPSIPISFNSISPLTTEEIRHMNLMYGDRKAMIMEKINGDKEHPEK